MTADHPSLERHTDNLLCGPHWCAGSVPHCDPWKEIYSSRSSQKPVYRDQSRGISSGLPDSGTILEPIGS
jgi:hypothetical protein